jgi:hypothetical protein
VQNPNVSQMHQLQDFASDQKIELTIKCLRAVPHYQGLKNRKKSRRRGPQNDSVNSADNIRNFLYKLE